MSLHPPSTLLMGPGGSGKTTVLKTLLASGLKVRMLATEPTAPNRVLEECKKANIDSSKFDWQFISPSPTKWASLLESARMVNTMSLEQIAKTNTGIAKSDGTQWIKMLEAIQNFTSDRTGQVLGDATEWGPDCAFVIDGLTGISTMSRNLTVGLKPNPAPGEWGVMQGNILNLIRKLCADSKCFFVLIAHIERETNELTGGSSITVSTLGAKLAPKLPPEFTTVVSARKDGFDFWWSTATQGVDTKSGDLPLSDKIIPDFTPIVTGFRLRLQSLSSDPQGSKPPLTGLSAKPV